MALDGRRDGERGGAVRVDERAKTASVYFDVYISPVKRRVISHVTAS